MNNKSYVLIGAAAIIIGFLVMKEEHPSSAPQKSPQQVEKQNNEIDRLRKATNPYVIPTMPTVAGNYLSARFAIANDDLASASKYFQGALKLSDNPKEKSFLYERTLPAALGAGDLDDAIKYSAKMDFSKPTVTAQLAVLTQLVEGFKKSDYAQNDVLLKQLRNDGFGRLLKPLLQSWNAAGQKDFKKAEAQLQTLKQEYPSLLPLVQMHRAFLFDLQDKNEPAEKLYLETAENNLSIRSAYIIASFYEQNGKTEEVKKLYQRLATTMPGASLPVLILKRVEDNKQFAERPFIAKPLDGVAAALYDVATVLHQEGSSRLAILYAQMAHYLAPQDDFTKLLISDILASDPVLTQAEDFLKSVPKESDLYVLARTRLAQLYEQQQEHDKAVKIFQKFLKNPITRPQALMDLGDLYRRKEDFAKAIPFYTEIINGKKDLVEADWVLLYSRGMCYERNNQWDLAEKDLLRAVELSPRQPEVLNYLAYSWADHGKNLTQALDMLQKALAGAPTDPYIIDSVGWALYKNGQADDAVPYLEAAVQELPADAVINGHLGDIYWAVGRRLEARFQWERALKNTKETDTALRKEYTEKLKNGLTDEKKSFAHK